ncbi:hypothetical protein SAMN05518668_109179 [Sphingobium sp. YR657]|uniref:HNH endonuclease n=1 Tax=Sphingobium sp. YR657 TaxID=1884366 RepID=UPI00091E2739|nr:hypothetical protein [Sphingobium sp. YR657]SHM44947.1 hypothetical protein SAMN05518668_109179 [Sphingobium sp. YR657]
MNEEIERVREVIEPGSSTLSAFDYLIAHARAAAFNLVHRISEVRAVELQWPDRRLNPFAVQVRPGHLNFYLRSPILRAYPLLFEAAAKRFGPVQSNGRGEYRTRLHSQAEVDALLDFLREQGGWPSKKSDRRFVAGTFAPVTGEHFLRAAQRLSQGLLDHKFGPSKDYDLLFDDVRLPPKAVFGVAASEALGFEVRPENFSAGESMVCFRMLRSSGYLIVPKGDVLQSDAGLISEEDRSWAEGSPRLVTHLRRERGAGLAAAKRDQFRAKYGRLRCERCRMDPVEIYGAEFGEACIEVHHSDTHVADMKDGHLTRLEELQCLCANCHRVVHRELKARL